MAPVPVTDSLEEFASEQAPAPSRVAPAPTAPVGAPGRASSSHLSRLRPAVIFVAAVVAVAAAGVVVPRVVNRGTIEQPPPAIAPPSSPIEVEYPAYPGAPLVQAAAAAMPAPLEAAASPPLTVNRERLEAPHRPIAVPRVEPEVAHAFDVRSPVPQVASTVPAAVAIANEETPPPADSPPRRLGPPIVVATLGGSISQQGRVVLVLEVTEQGDVARIVSREGVDVHPDVIDSVVAAARSWRYAPARRDGVAVPARVRVVVQLNGANTN